MKKLIMVLGVFASLSSLASIWDGDIDITQNYACLGLDGVPIGNNSSVASKCCSNGELVSNPPESCYAGFATIAPDANVPLSNGITIGSNAIADAQVLDTISMQVPPSGAQGGSISLNSVGEGVASMAGTGMNGNGMPIKSGANSAANELKSKSGGSGSAGGLGGGGGGGSTLGSVGGTSGLKGAEAGAYDKSNGSGFVKAGGEGDSKGKNGAGLYGSLGGAGGSNGAGVGVDGKMDSLSFGENSGANGDGSGANGLGDDGDGIGTAEDPSDYFSRIDKSANIFKIVSARYMKKKSLWKVHQSSPGDLKQNKI